MKSDLNLNAQEIHSGLRGGNQELRRKWSQLKKQILNLDSKQEKKKKNNHTYCWLKTCSPLNQDDGG